MKLTVSGMKTGDKNQFRNLWGRYILGFRPWKHCIDCFQSKVAKGITPGMVDGEYLLDSSFPLFYLCGVGWKDRGNTNVHLAVRPRLGSVACVGSVYGVQFTITNAQSILIHYLPKEWQGLDDKHSQCKNFQFGYQMFDANEVCKSAPRNIVTSLREDTDKY